MNRHPASSLQSARRALRALALAAALSASLAVPPIAAAQGATVAATPFDAAQAEYAVGHYAAAFAAFAALADAGHAEAARIALLMRRHGPALYGADFAVADARLQRWTAAMRSAAAAHDELVANCSR